MTKLRGRTGCLNFIWGKGTVAKKNSTVKIEYENIAHKIGQKTKKNVFFLNQNWAKTCKQFAKVYAKNTFGSQKPHIGIKNGPIYCWVIRADILTTIRPSVIT